MSDNALKSAGVVIMSKITDPYTLCTLNAGLNSGSDDRAVHVHEMLLMNRAEMITRTIRNIAVLTKAFRFLTTKKKFWRNFMLGRLVRGGFRDVVRDVVQISLFVFSIQSLKLVEALLALELGLLEEIHVGP
jgi:hypothetical protein